MSQPISTPVLAVQTYQFPWWLAALLVTVSAAVLAIQPIAAFAQEDERIIEEIITIGTRSETGRTVLESPVPVDLLSEENIVLTGATETGRAIQSLAPSFNFSSSSISDGTDALRPATLRGLGPDQTLVLVNGKRRHTSALIHVNTSVGRGTAGTDLNAIPTSAIKRIEVLRDGAAAQYGSDAIAGVINLVLKDEVDYGRVTASYGGYEAGDGETSVVSANKGWGVMGGGYFHIAAEYRDRSATNRTGLDGSRQYPLQADGSFDPREFTFNRKSFRIGDAESEQNALMLNAGMPLGDKAELYSFITYSDRDNTSGGFYRTADDNRNPPGSNYPDGFLPLINTEIEDYSAHGGVRTDLAEDWHMDLSVGVGRNDFDFRVSNSHNASLVACSSTTEPGFTCGSSPSSADAGSLVMGLVSVNLDLNKDMDWGLVAFGAEYRRDTYELNAGDPLSYLDFDGPSGAPGGIQVFPGFQPSNEVDESRNAKSLYVDVEYNLTQGLMLEGAVRYEDYSDFGDTVTGKVAFRWHTNEWVTLRGAVSSGFRAPSMQQSFFNNVSTQFNSMGVPFEVGTFRNDSPVIQALGVPDLKEEESINYSIGLVMQPMDNLNVTVDVYRIDIDDRIVVSGQLTSGIDAALDALLASAGASSAQFFLNAADTQTEGVDLIVTYDVVAVPKGELRVSLAANFTNTTVEDIFAPTSLASIPNIENIIYTEQDQSILESWQPEDRINLSFKYAYEGFSGMLAFNRYGEYTVTDGDTQTYGAEILTDLQLNYGFSNGLTLTLGGNNIFDETPDTNRIGQARSSPTGGLVDPVTGQFVVNSPGVFHFSRRAAPFGFNGAFYYLKASYQF